MYKCKEKPFFELCEPRTWKTSVRMIIIYLKMSEAVHGLELVNAFTAAISK